MGLAKTLLLCFNSFILYSSIVVDADEWMLADKMSVCWLVKRSAPCPAVLHKCFIDKRQELCITSPVGKTTMQLIKCLKDSLVFFGY